MAGQYDNLPTLEVNTPQNAVLPVTDPYKRFTCVTYIRSRLGLTREQFSGDAWQIEPTTQEGKVGDIILTKEGLYHVAIISGETETHWILDEANYNNKGQILRGRLIHKQSLDIRGYYIPVDNSYVYPLTT